MKNKIKNVSTTSFLLLFLLFVSTVYSQEFKFIQGFNLASYSIQPEEYAFIGFPPIVGDYEINFISGLLIGGGIEFNVSKNIAIEIDALFFQKGSIVSVAEDEFQFLKWDYGLNALSFPILIKIKLRSGPSAYFLGGGELSFILTHKENGNNISEDTETFDYGLIAGGGIEIKLKNSIVCLEGRYHLGLKNILKEHWKLESIKTNAIVLIVGIKI